jgi:hypothetical protein
MLDNPGSDHIQIDIGHTAFQVPAGLDSRSVVSIFPERAPPLLSPIIFLTYPPLHQLHRSGDCPLITSSKNQKMDVI